MVKNHCAARMISLAAALLLLVVLLPVTARADAYDPNQKGSIAIQLQDLGTPMGDVTFCCYKVGTLGTGLQVNWVLVSELESTGVDLNIKSASDAQKAAELLQKAVKEKGLTGTEKSTDSAGKVEFTELEHGMYLLVQTNTAQYGLCEPFLVAVPFTDENGLWEYDVKATPKGQLIPTPTPGTAPTPTPTVTPAPKTEPTPTPLPGILPQTGDASNPVLWLVLACASGAVVIALVCLKKRRPKG